RLQQQQHVCSGEYKEVTDCAAPISSNAHVDSTSVQERRMNSPLTESRNSTNEPIEEVDSAKGEVFSNERKTLKRHLGLFSGIAFILGMIIGD
ncbi:unnamed protein product, partial [Rotaria sp. Silwood1]